MIGHGIQAAQSARIQRAGRRGQDAARADPVSQGFLPGGVDGEPGGAAEDGAGEDAPGFPPECSRQAQGGEGQQIVQDHALPAPGVGTVEDELQGAEGETRQQAPSQSPADGIEQDREHGRGDGAALGEFIELDQAQDLGCRHQHGPLGEGADAQMGFG